MRPDIDVAERTKERVAYLIGLYTKQLRELRKQDRKAAEYAVPLPWYAHEASQELELVVAHFKKSRRPKWSDFRVRRGSAALWLVFVK
jgi:hypothetical protein